MVPWFGPESLEEMHSTLAVVSWLFIFFGILLLMLWIPGYRTMGTTHREKANMRLTLAGLLLITGLGFLLFGLYFLVVFGLATIWSLFQLWKLSRTAKA